MKIIAKHALLLLLPVLLSTEPVFSEVREIQTMTQILSEIDRDTLVIFDLDNTVIEPEQSLGGDQWFSRMVADYQEQGLAERDAVDQAVERWTKVQPLVNVQPVEQRTPALIRDLQKCGIKVIALTARPEAVFTDTLRQLESISVDFSQSSLSANDITFELERSVLFSKGILLVNNTNKGLALLKLLSIVGVSPKKIVFVDDKVKNVQNVDDALDDHSGVTHIEFRYGAADPRVAAYEHELALFQESFIGKIINDDQARVLMDLERK